MKLVITMPFDDNKQLVLDNTFDSSELVSLLQELDLVHGGLEDKTLALLLNSRFAKVEWVPDET